MTETRPAYDAGPLQLLEYVLTTECEAQPDTVTNVADGLVLIAAAINNLADAVRATAGSSVPEDRAQATEMQLS